MPPLLCSHTGVVGGGGSSQGHTVQCGTLSSDGQDTVGENSVFLKHNFFCQSDFRAVKACVWQTAQLENYLLLFQLV